MVESIRILELSLGSIEKSFLSSERSCFEKLGKSVVAGRDLRKGEKLQKNHLKIKVSQPHGFKAVEVTKLYGLELKVDVEEDEVIAEEKLFLPKDEVIKKDKTEDN